MLLLRIEVDEKVDRRVTARSSGRKSTSQSGDGVLAFSSFEMAEEIGDLQIHRTHGLIELEVVQALIRVEGKRGVRIQFAMKTRQRIVEGSSLERCTLVEATKRRDGPELDAKKLAAGGREVLDRG